MRTFLGPSVVGAALVLTAACSTVDSENGFGAKIRSSFVCTVTHTGGDSWHLDDISLN